MNRYFTVEERNVMLNGNIVENVPIVCGIIYSDDTNIPFGYFEYKDEYGLILGKMLTYDDNNGKMENISFIDVEFIEEESQLDRIEHGTTQLLTDIKAEAVDEYTLELMNEGVL